MRTRMLAAVYAVLAACAGSEPQPTLTITPSGNQTASGPVTITAGPLALANEVTWSTTVPGTISGDKGPSVVYHPPPSTQPVTATAAARGQTKTAAFTNGVNAYIAFLKANPTLMPGEYAQVLQPMTPNDIRDWELQDTLAVGRLQQFQLSETIEKETGYGLFALTFAPGLGAHPDAARFTAYVRA